MKQKMNRTEKRGNLLKTTQTSLNKEVKTTMKSLRISY